MSNFSIDGLVTGLDTSSIIEKLMNIERAPSTTMLRQKSAYDAQASAWNDINSALSSLSTSANELSTTQKMALYAATSSAASLATATVTGASNVAPTSITLRVGALATAHQAASSGAASATSALGGGTATLGVGLPALGIGFARADGTVSSGGHAVVVTQASGSATITGGMWGGSVSIGPANNEVTVVVNGVTRIVQIAEGSYSTLQALAGAVGVALGTDVSVTAAGGRLQVSTVAEGSAATLQFTGGSALASLGLSAGAAVNGTNGIVTVDGVANTITSAAAGTQTTLTGATGSFAAELSGGLRTGSGTLHVLRSDAGDSLTDLAADIAAADSSIRTQTLDTGTGASPFRLVASATSTGLGKAFTLDFSGYTGIGDGAETLNQGRNASFHIGGLALERASNTLTDVVAGVTVNLQSANPNQDVTLTINRDTDKLAAKAKALVDGLNAVLVKVKTFTRYNAETNIAGTLNGDSRARDLASSLVSALQATNVSGSLTSLSQVGISMQRNGSVALDQAKFSKALTENYDDVVKLLARTGSATDARVSFVGATSATVARPSPYAVVVTQAAEQASVTGAAFGALGANETISVTTASGTVTYNALAGADADTVAAGLNAAFTTARAGVTASVSGGAITLTTSGYGATSTLSVTAGATGLTGSDTGANVAGTIDGVAATGSGQILTGASGDASGLLVKVTATASDVTGAGGSLSLGTVAYASGAVGGLTGLLSQLTGSGGKVTTAYDSAVANSKSQQQRIDAFERRLTVVQERYTKQFASLETLMGRLKDQSAWLASQIAGLPGTRS